MQKNKQKWNNKYILLFDQKKGAKIACDSSLLLTTRRQQQLLHAAQVYTTDLPPRFRPGSRAGETTVAVPTCSDARFCSIPETCAVATVTQCRSGPGAAKESRRHILEWMGRWVFTFDDDDGVVVKVGEHLAERPLVVPRDLVVALELLLLGRQNDVGQIWMLERDEGTCIL